MAALAGLAVASIAAWVLAFETGDLDTERRQLRQWARATQRPSAAAIDALWARHPASAVVSAQVAYLRETANPPDLPGALRAANRTLYLAPKYADGHLIAGRLLVRAGRRAQGFEAMREAWRLSAARRPLVVEQIARWAASPEELLRAIPRRDALLDRFDESEWARSIEVLVVKGIHPEWIPRLFAALPTDPSTVPFDRLPLVVRASITARQPAVGLEWVRYWRSQVENTLNTTLFVRLLTDGGHLEEALRVLAELPNSEDDSTLRLRIELAVKTGHFSQAHALLDRLNDRLSPTREHRAEIARMRAHLHVRAGETHKAVAALSEVLEHLPGETDARLTRARLLAGVGRRGEALADINYVLRRRPQDATARSLKKTLEATKER
ncbi:MAG: hypothetical protein AAFV29_18655 [Myxococcota bacterium]